MSHTRKSLILSRIDKPILFIYIGLVIMGWFNIYAAVFNDAHQSIFDLNMQYGKQLIWIVAAFIIAASIMLIDSKFFPVFTYPIYGLTVAMLLVVLFFGREVNGARAWFEVGGIRLQPGELAKVATCLAVARILGGYNVTVYSLKTLALLAGILALPGIVILLQNDTGSMLVYVAYVFVLYRQGLTGGVILLGVAAIILFVVALMYPPTYIVAVILFLGFVGFHLLRKYWNDLIVGILVFAISTGLAMLIAYFFMKFTFNNVLFTTLIICVVPYSLHAYKHRLWYIFGVMGIVIGSIVFVYSVAYLYNKVLEPHQKTRIAVLLGLESDLKGAEYNVNQSKIAIGSGGFSGKGYLQGTQTKFNFVPEQSTDFIFCTVGEEWGFLGGLVVIGLFVAMLVRLVILAEKQRSVFSRLYGYGVVAIIFFHFTINVGMTIGMVPVIGIPLPFFSYGGSSLWSFTALLFIFLRLDIDRDNLVH